MKCECVAMNAKWRSTTQMIEYAGEMSLNDGFNSVVVGVIV